MIQAVEITTRLLKENKNYELNERKLSLLFTTHPGILYS